MRRGGRDFCSALGCAALVGTVACGGRLNLGGASNDDTFTAGRASQGGFVSSMSGSAGAGGGLYAIGGAYGALQPCQRDFQSSTWIAFDSDREDYDRELYLVHPDGSGLTRLTRRPGADQEPAFAPDGQSLAFTSDREDSRELDEPRGKGNTQVFLLELASGVVTALTDRVEGASQPSFSHDGSRLAFRSGLGVYTISRDGSDERLVATADDTGQGCAWPRFSKDDTHLIYDRNSRIEVTALDGSPPRMIVENFATTIQAPALADDGLSVAYQAACDNSPTLSIWSALYTMTTGPCAGSRLTPPGEPHSEHPSWGPEDHISYARVDVVRNVGQLVILSRARGSTPCAVTTDYSDNRNPSWYSAVP